jgi:putative FmdB family regulatory protein
MPTYNLQCQTCNHEWEDFFSIVSEIPQHCPNCNQDGNVKRLISGGSGRGIVEANASELLAKNTEHINEMKKRAAKDENYRANLVGENKWNKIVK